MSTHSTHSEPSKYSKLIFVWYTNGFSFLTWYFCTSITLKTNVITN